MKSEERQKKVMDLLEGQEYLRTSEILEKIPSSPATIRRDLVFLEQSGKIRKARGRIFPADNSHILAFSLREMIRDDEKNEIGRAAAKLVCEGDTIMLDAGTTVLAMTEYLRHMQKLSVLTNSIPVAYALKGTKVNVFLCGGMLEDMTLVDDDAVNFFANHSANKAFLGTSGVLKSEGLTAISPFHTAVKRQMIKSSTETYALFDASKLNIMGVNIVARFHELTGVVTSKQIENEELLKQLEINGVKIFYAK